ncbi:MAG TPA: glycerol-3-phosphate 1-O-acyltransferase PlsY [Thermomicrobiales bacterium]|nr:glycerol-3-phosphate 1-O-acyltransferase PlsY [Thermomicrobiales bacterium]
MSEAAAGIALVVIAYLVGGIPWGVVLGRLFQQTDLRNYGSGGTGATNALRVLGWRISAVVLVLDFLKGFAPVFVALRIGLDGWWAAAAGVAAVAGHCWSPYIGFRGGKGMATGAGAAAALFPAVLLAAPIVVVIVALTRYVSLASLTVSVAASVALVALAAGGRTPWSVATAVVVITAIIVYKHEGNIKRLLSGTERRFGERAVG